MIDDAFNGAVVRTNLTEILKRRRFPTGRIDVLLRRFDQLDSDVTAAVRILTTARSNLAVEEIGDNSERIQVARANLEQALSASQRAGQAMAAFYEELSTEAI